MSNITKITCIIVSAISLLFIAKYLEVGVCMRANQKTNRYVAKSVTSLRQERDEKIAELEKKIQKLEQDRLAPCDVQGLTILPE